MREDDRLQNESVFAPNILIVEDDHGIGQLIQRTLERNGLLTTRVVKGAEAIEQISQGQYGLLLLDYQLPDMTGKQVVERLSKTQRLVPFVMMTGQGDERIAVEMMKLGARDYVVKDAAFIDLLPQVVKRVVREISAEKKLVETEAKLLEAKRSIFTLLSNLPGMAYRCQNDSARTMTFVSEGCTALTGFPPADLVGNSKTSFMELIHEDDREMVLNEIQSALAEKRPFQTVYRIRSDGDQQKWIWEKGSGVLSSEGDVEALEGFMADITERKEAEAQVLEYTKQLETLFDIALATSGTLDIGSLLDSIIEKILSVMEFEAGGIFLFDQQTNELVLKAHKGISERLVKKAEGLTSSQGPIARLALSGKPIIVSDIDLDSRLKHADTRIEGFEAFVAIPIIAKERILGLMAVGSQKARQFPPSSIHLLSTISSQIGMSIDNAQLYERALQLAFTDSLTGLYNRRYLLEEFDREFARANRNGSSLSLIMIDLDDLKIINDRFGHNEGDIALRELARILRLNTRTSDLAARWGGDEFVLLAPDTDTKRARIIGERIRSEVERSRPTAVDQQMAIRVSVGIASYPAHASCVTELIKRADQAMYNAKGLGKNQVCVFHNGKAEYGHMRRQN